MKYTPKKKDVTIRAIYFILFVFSIFSMNIGKGYVKTIFYCLSILSLVASLYLLIRYEFYRYEYIITDKDDKYYFYINKYIGRRGAYVCYFSMDDAVEIKTKSEISKKELQKQYDKISFNSYCQNITITKDRTYLIFKDDDSYICLVLEMSGDIVNEINEYIKKKNG